MSILAVAKIEIMNSFRGKISYVIFALAFLFILLVRGCATAKVSGAGLIISEATWNQIVMTIAFNSIVFWSLTLCGLLSSGVIVKELEEKTIVMVLSRPIKRSVFIAGKLLATMGVSTFNFFLLGIIYSYFCYTETQYFNANIFYAFGVVIINMLLITIVSFLFSLLLPRNIVSFVVLMIYITSVWIELPFYFTKLTTIWQPSETHRILHEAFPRLGGVQFLGSSLLYSGAKDWMAPVINVIFYSVVSWIMLILIFNKKQL